MAAWYPLGPDFVFEPIRENFLRLSRRNERGVQGTVTHIAASPHDTNTILAIDAPSSGGSALHVSEDGGETWRSLLEPLHHSTAPGFGSELDPTCTAFHPAIAGTVYLGTGTKRTLYRSTAGFSGWSVVHTFAGGIREILIDPRTTTLATTTILVATTEGLFLTTNGGADWASVLAGSIRSVSGDFPAAGAPSVWASVRETGLFHSTNLTGWTNVSTGPALAPGASGPLPSPANLDSFIAFLVDFSRVQPQRVYAWAVKDYTSLALFRSNNGAAGPWMRIAAPTLPNPWSSNLRNCVFAVAPQSAGTGTTDILLFGGLFFNRSVDGGLTWEAISHAHGAPVFHVDFWSFAFAPPRPPFSGVPLLLVGCDGGIASSTNYASSAPISTSPDLNEDVAVVPGSPAFRALNRGRGGSALYAMATDPRIAQLNYIGCVDTGVARGGGGLGWRSFSNADAGVLAAAPGPDGVSVWFSAGLISGFPFFYIAVITDQVEPGGLISDARLGPSGALVGATSNLLVDGGDACVGGLVSYTVAHTLLSDIPAGFGVHEFTLDSLDGVEAGTTLMFRPDVEQRTPKVVDAIVDAATNRVRTIEGSGGFPPGTPVNVVGTYVGRIDRTGLTTRISQNLGLFLQAPFCVAIGPGSSMVAACATHTEDSLRGDLGTGTFDPNPIEKLFVTSAGTTAMSTWSEVTSGRPEGSRIANVAVDVAGTVFVLLTEAVGGTPLYRIDSNVWTAAPGSGAPSGGPPFGRLIAHPTLANRLYAAHGGRVYAIESGGGTVGSSRVDLQACKLEYSIVSPK